MSMTIALAGNPNSGKTTLFNHLTGASQYVGNWPGVTVEKKEGRYRADKAVTITDLPGIYSLSPYTLEEVVARDYLLDGRPDVIVNLVDATNIERNLYLTTQLMETGIPIVIALNMIDRVKKSGDKIDVNKLSDALGCPVVETSAVTGSGVEQLMNEAKGLAQKNAKQSKVASFTPSVETAVNRIAERIAPMVNQVDLRWYAVKLFERDEKAIERINLNSGLKKEIEEIITAVEDDQDDDSESIITGERYVFVTGVVKKSVQKKPVALTPSDKIDRVVTNRFLAIPIFVAIMWGIYYVTVSWLGTIVTDWTNDVLFGEIIGGNVLAFMENQNVAPWLTGLIVDGMIGGVGAVLGFVPQMLILFFFLSILEDCGYMARIAFIMDRLFRKFGLSGKSFIPMLIGTGCGVPGIMASRTIENENDRRMTIITTTFIPCGAKLPIIALIAGAIFPSASWVAPSAYFLGVGAIIFSGIILKKMKLFSGDPAPFVMELPQYHIPRPRGVLTHMWERSKAFIIKAGTIIFIACGLVWFLSNFGFTDGAFGMVKTDVSILAVIGGFIAPIFRPLGFGTWQATVATITGLVAKENVVGTFGVLFGIAEAAEDDPMLLQQIAMMFTGVSALSFLTFNLLCAPCFAAIGAIKREMGSLKWTFIAIGYQTVLAYAVALIIYQLGSMFALGAGFGIGQIVAILLLALMVYLLLRKPKDNPTTRMRSAGAANY